ncbi:DNA cytosine methyltransferase [Mesobacillus sp. AQ2]|uniref:DNA cytosine methyltransferase n=1 Tax=Mesobacillus sp. AQ2 TaxID=3043332 RepID=UPI0024C1BDCC|nr:DNA cytosine methyltransferase [Mesobacillus sp. AQ2]WHX41177.1 DNA cytosine methyltransferase [Mesobacillus sp. AQ2]
MNFIDIFAGCGGLSEGFKQNPNYNMLAAVEWERPQVENLRNHLRNNYNMIDANERVIRFDIQRTEELINGWENDEVYDSHVGLDAIIGDLNVDLIIGGPPCQAYSVAGRIRDENGMRNDYRNFLFESYMRLVRHYQPNMFVFENVPGMLSARPDGETLVTDLIRAEINNSGYEIVDDLKTYAQYDFSDYGVPQKRKRVIIIGVKNGFKEDIQQALHQFYHDILPQYRENRRSVQDAIGDLPPIIPAESDYILNGRKYSHIFNNDISNHVPRYHNRRDINIFNILCEDIESGRNEYTTSQALMELYTQMTGRNSNIHKYHVLRWDQPSNTIPAHLYKDGLRHIHPDSTQSRSITVREAARLQTFPNNYTFISSMGDNYKMIGNAVPPLFAQKLASALIEFNNI